MCVTLESRCEGGAGLELVGQLVANAVHVGVLVAFMSDAGTANLRRVARGHRGHRGHTPDAIHRQTCVNECRLTVNRECVESRAIDSPRCFTGMLLSLTEISVTVFELLNYVCNLGNDAGTVLISTLKDLRG